MNTYAPPVENVCRTCMGESCQPKAPKKRRTNSLISMFSELESIKDNMTIMELLRLTTPQLTIETDDLLPKTMCSTCVDKLLDTHEFQQMCIRVEQSLRQTVIKEDDDDELKEEPDPLNSSITQPAFNDLSNVVKVELDELDEPMIDNEIMDNKQVQVVEIYKAEDEISDNEHFNDEDRLLVSSDDENSDWEPDFKVDEKPRRRNKNKLNQSEANKQLKTEDKDAATEEDISDDKKHFGCVDCGRQLKTLKSLNRHKERLHSGKPLANECKFCGEVFEMKKMLQKHLKTHPEYQNENKIENKRKSHDDKKDTDYKIESLEDKEDSSGIAGTEQKKSPKKNEEDDWETDGTASEHIEENQNTDAASSDKVSKVKQKGANKNKKLFCKQCGYGLKTHESWKRHIKRVHSGVKPQAKTFKCKNCDKVFDQFVMLKEHWKEHAGGEKLYLCPECGKSFTTLSNMNQHLLRHGTDRPYECPHCPLRYPTLSDLASHKLMHTTIKPYVCDVCGMAFVRPSLLKTHKKYHTGEKNYKCDYCDMRFVLGSQCQRHMRIHTGEKPFKCDYCPSSFKQGGELKKHLRTHLGINVYRCSMCPQAFRLNSILRDHLISHKNEDEETRLKNLQALKNEDLILQLKFGLVQPTGENQ